MVLDVVNDGCWPHEIDAEAPFAQRLTPELMPSEPTPPSIIVGTASGIAALAAAFGMQAGERVEAHRQ
jgi:hypothetical protein